MTDVSTATPKPPKTTNVRVTRTQKLTVVEYVDIQICQDDGDHKDPTSLAETLVIAMDAAGQDIDWVQVSETPESYPRATFDATTVEDKTND